MIIIIIFIIITSSIYHRTVNKTQDSPPTLALASLAASASAAMALCSITGSLASLLGEHLYYH